jgi:hypothetical protein
MISPIRSLNSSNWRSRSASRTFWKMICFDACAWMRPNSIGGSGSTMKSPIAVFDYWAVTISGRPFQVVRLTS